MASRALEVHLEGQVIDLVFFDKDISTQEAQRSLIDHDGYDPRITVREEARVVPRAPSFVVVVRNDAWRYPDIFGPFRSHRSANSFADLHIEWRNVDVDDVTVQQLLGPEEYTE
jgi:hypothetical protein